MDDPLLSVCIITYNHGAFIEKAIEGVLMQKVNFGIEIIIADDFSTDGTRELLLEYKGKYPSLIKLILQQKNVGPARNWMDLITAPRTKYVAYFEGDDYWCDTCKLQKQVDFLEKSDDFAFCFHKVYELKDGKELVLSNLNSSDIEVIYTIADLAKGNFIHTPSVVFRNSLFKEFPSWFIDSPVGDYPLHMLNAKYGLIKYFPEPMAVYRRHSKSTWSSKPKIHTLDNWNKVLEFLKREFDGEIKDIIEKQQFRILMELSDLYSRDHSIEDQVTIIAKAITLNQSCTKEWIVDYYLPLVQSVQEKKQNPAGIKDSLKHLLKMARTRLIK